MPAEVSNSDKLEFKGQGQGQIKLERSKTERQRPNNIRAEEAAQIFDAKVSVQQKVNFSCCLIYGFSVTLPGSLFKFPNCAAKTVE